MNAPKPHNTPPAWYWRLPLKWRQRYCHWYIHTWEALYAFFTNILTRETLFQQIPRAIKFTQDCWSLDRVEGRSRRESLNYLGAYWKTCWEHWLHPLPKEMR